MSRDWRLNQQPQVGHHRVHVVKRCYRGKVHKRQPLLSSLFQYGPFQFEQAFFLERPSKSLIWS